MPYFDKRKERLVYIQESPTADYWDGLWDEETVSTIDLTNIRQTYVSRITKKHLKPEDGRILEGGCGYGQHVAALANNNYYCTGIDYAPKTVAYVNKVAPNLDVRLGDLRKLEFDDASFVGYWSLGVIEHFWDGYESIAHEMKRVIKHGGYLFVTFPYMSPLRRLKAYLNQYPQWQGSTQPDNFYQFALNYKPTAAMFQNLGFRMVKSRPLDGIKGFTSENHLFRHLLQKLYDYRGDALEIRAFRLLLSNGLAFFAGHMMLLVLQRVDG